MACSRREIGGKPFLAVAAGHAGGWGRERREKFASFPCCNLASRYLPPHLGIEAESHVPS